MNGGLRTGLGRTTRPRPNIGQALSNRPRSTAPCVLLDIRLEPAAVGHDRFINLIQKPLGQDQCLARGRTTTGGFESMSGGEPACSTGGTTTG